MKIKFTQTNRKFEHVFPALFLTAIICSVFATLGWLHLLPAALAGLAVPLIPQMKQRNIRYVLLGLLGAFLLIRFPSVLDGAKLLANRMFSLSEQTQSYEYDYFAAAGESSAETVLWLSVLAGFFCTLWGNRFNTVLAGSWIIAMAYFGVTPSILWLVILVLAGLLNALPGQQRWFHAIVVTILVAAIAFSMGRIAPEPIKAVSALDDQLRNTLAAAPVTYEQAPVPTQVPEPEIIPPANTQQEQPDHGVQNMAVNILFVVLAALTLAILFIPAVIKDRAAKKREQNRAGLNNADHAAAIKAMYLYAMRFRSLSNTPSEIPANVYAIWQEAAYSDHTMTEDQRKIIHSYMVETAKAAWAEADWKKRLLIQYRIAL